MENEGCSRGPVSTMPGSASQIEFDEVCECGAPAQYKVQGETDSFGCEYLFLCKGCLAVMRAEAMKPREFCCDLCHERKTERPINYRDYEEGASGRLYVICRACKNCCDAYDREMAEQQDYD